MTEKSARAELISSLTNTRANLAHRRFLDSMGFLTILRPIHSFFAVALVEVYHYIISCCTSDVEKQGHERKASSCEKEYCCPSSKFDNKRKQQQSHIMSAFPSTSTSFRCVFIPAEITSPLVEKEFSKSGGLTDDALRKAAEAYFARDASLIDREAEQRVVGDALVKQGLDPSKVGELLGEGSPLAGLSAKVEIIAVTCATDSNGFSAVSMYCDGHSGLKPGCKSNSRATALAKACGHAIEIRGDCFIGRAFDDEREEWERRDFLVADMNLDAPWVLQAKAANAGKNMSGHRTSGIQQKLLGSSGSSDDNGSEEGYLSFTESSDEIEVRFALPTGCSAGQLNVVIGGSKLKIQLKSGEKLPLVSPALQEESGAELSGNVIKDESTWAVAQEGDQRVLTITLANVEGSSIWKELLKSRG